MTKFGGLNAKSNVLSLDNDGHFEIEGVLSVDADGLKLAHGGISAEGQKIQPEIPSDLSCQTLTFENNNAKLDFGPYTVLAGLAGGGVLTSTTLKAPTLEENVNLENAILNRGTLTCGTICDPTLKGNVNIGGCQLTGDAMLLGNLFVNGVLTADSSGLNVINKLTVNEKGGIYVNDILKINEKSGGIEMPGILSVDSNGFACETLEASEVRSDAFSIAADCADFQHCDECKLPNNTNVYGTLSVEQALNVNEKQYSECVFSGKYEDGTKFRFVVLSAVDPTPQPYAESTDGLVKIDSFRTNVDGSPERIINVEMNNTTTLRFGGSGLDRLWAAPEGRTTPLITLSCGDTEDQNLMCSGQPADDCILADWTPSGVCGWEVGSHDVVVEVSYGTENPEILQFNATFNIA